MQTVLELLTQPEWHHLIKQQVAEQSIVKLTEFLIQEEQLGSTIYPAKKNWWRALNELPPDRVRVVILGQDPYHGPGQAQGLSFSVPEGAKLPPSLRNIFKEQKYDLGIDNHCGDLTNWLQQGVLLLNAVLTVEASRAGSHARKGWEEITDAVISVLSDQQEQVVFMLWGGYAEKKKSLIDSERHLVLNAAHPSPLSAHRGWFGSAHFSRANRYLAELGYPSVDWQTGSSDQLSLL